MPIKFNLEKYLNSVYIETGYFRGESLKFAISTGFKKLHSIEINKVFYEQGLYEFENHENIFLHLGSSLDVLPSLLDNLNERATFYLDAHDLNYAGMNPSSYEKKHGCPIIDELEIIKSHKIKNHTLIIDDLRVFDGLDNKNKPYSWAEGTNISIQKIKEKVLEINSDYKFIEEDGVIENDVLVCYI
jgi:hypothetical protein